MCRNVSSIKGLNQGIWALCGQYRSEKFVTKGKKKITSDNISVEDETVRKETGVFQKPYELKLGPRLVSIKDTELCSMQ